MDLFLGFRDFFVMNLLLQKPVYRCGKIGEMRVPFVPKDFKPPKEVSLGKYKLLPITTNDVNEDLQVIRSNAEIILKLRGGSRDGWPFKCTLEENFKDLAWLELCAEYKQLFSYILRSKDDNKYIGCIYIYPIDLFFPEKASEYDVDFSFWIIRSVYDKSLYEQIFRDLFTWLIKEWPFIKSRIFLRNKEIPKEFKKGEKIKKGFNNENKL